jgi:tetratricopeptide (TPR) repeat protein
MSNVEKLKKRAAEFEAKRQTDKAIATYLEIFDAWDGEDLANIEVSLYNRAGDLMLREGQVGDAVSVWEKAVDLYADGGFHNNAIALCNKILRSSPGRASVYYKLGKISAQKGFRGDAKKNFLEYADRKQKANDVDEAFRALKEFADLCPDEDDIRQMLADQLAKLGRNDEAIEQLQHLYDRYETAGASAEAAATVDRMRALDPTIEPRRNGPRRSVETQGLVFIDLDDPKPRQSVARPAVPAPEPTPEPTPRPSRAVVPEGIPLLDVDEVIEPVETMDGLEPTAVEATSFAGAEEAGELTIGADASLLGLEATSLGAGTDADDSVLEPLELDVADPSVPVAPAEGLEVLPDLDLSEVEVAAPLDLIVDAAPDMIELETSSELEFIVDDEVSVDEPAASDEPAAADDGFGGLPMLDVDAPPARPTRSTMSIMAQSVDPLRDRVAADPENWQLRREFGEALLEDGEREQGVAELESAMSGFERGDDLESARSVADELIRLSPLSVRLHQKRVEYAVRMSDRPRLIEAYIELADALFKAGQAEKSRAVYERVIELAPDDVRAQAALDTLGETPVVPEPAPEPRKSQSGRYTAAAEVVVPPEPVAPAPEADDDFVSLGDWLRDEEAPKSTRMVVDEEAPSGDEDADFKDMLRKFKQGVAENVEEEDHESHYDLGVAFKEMGLIDEAIAEFQKALRGTAQRVRTYEALGQCFAEKGQLQVAMTILQRALGEPGAGDDQLVGVLYLLGNGAEELGRNAEAIGYYQRVFGVDITFRDVTARLQRLESAG